VSDNKGVENELNDMLHKKVLMEEHIWGLERTISKYGNAYGELLVSDQGLIGINFLPPATMRRVEDHQGRLLGFVQDIRGEFNLSIEDFYKLAAQRGTNTERTRAPGVLTVFEDWEVVHWRLRGKHLNSAYGHGVADSARWVWKRLVLLEDSLLIYKLTRAPSRYVFYIDVGQYDTERGLAYINRVKNQFKKQSFINPSSGKLDMRYNPLSQSDDFFVPTQGGKESTRIESLQGPDYSETDTLEYHRDALVSALKTPKNYMGLGGESTRAALSNEDIKFARTVMRVQRETRSGTRKACRVHMIAKNIDADRHEYDVKMSVPSAILELAKIEVMSATADLATRMGEILSTKWILTTLFKYSEQEAENLMKDKDTDAIRKAKVDAESQRLLTIAQTPPEEAGGGAPGEAEVEKEKGGEAEPGGGGGAEMASRNLSSRDMLMLERRIGQLLKRHQEDVERSFDRKVRLSRNADAKLVEALKGDPALAKRIRNVQGLLKDVRSSMHSGL